MPHSIQSNEVPKKVKATRPAHLHRITAEEVITARKLILLACLGLEPNDRTQRQVFSSFMPDIYILRNKEGYTFKQVTSFLHECGLKLKESSVRVYYTQMFPAREEECIRIMNEQIPLWAAIRKEVEGTEISLIAGKVMEILERNRVQNGF